jgi:hypothetical protein
MKLARSADKRLRIRSINIPLIRGPRRRVESERILKWRLEQFARRDQAPLLRSAEP